MLFEARFVAQVNVADELSNILENEDTQRNTLHSDKTSKKRALIFNIMILIRLMAPVLWLA